jgi:uncharacterized membrane protein
MQVKSFKQINSRQNKLTGSSNSRWLFALLAIAIAIGIFFRFANLDKKVYWNDEAVTSLRISGYTEAEVIQKAYTNSPIDVSEFMRYQHPDASKGFGGVVNSLAQEDAHLSLLYHVAARLWIDCFGSSVAVVRSLSALFSLFALPCLYWLCKELFNSPLTGWVAMALMAVSPFHLLYAQEARQYSLWTFATLLSCAALLRALRVQTLMSWLVYGASVAGGIYSHTLFILVAIGHGIYALFRERFQIFSKNFLSYSLAAIAGIFAFVPWFAIVLDRLEKVNSNVSRTNINVGLLSLIKSWVQSLNRVFVDIPGVSSYLFPAIFLLTILSLYYLVRNSPKKTYFFVLILIGTFLVFAIPDILLGGKRSTDSRYLIPSYLGIEIAVAYFLSSQITNLKLRQQQLGNIIVVFLLSIGIVSGMFISGAYTWWNKYSGYHNYQIAQIVNRANNPLVISDNMPGRVLSISHLLDNQTKLLLLTRSQPVEIPETFQNIFVYQPSSNLRDRLNQEKNYKLNKTSKGWLWKLDRVGK